MKDKATNKFLLKKAIEENKSFFESHKVKHRKSTRRMLLTILGFEAIIISIAIFFLYEYLKYFY